MMGMLKLPDVRGRLVRLTDERREHLETSHPEMSGQTPRIVETLQQPDRVVRSRTGEGIELFYRLYEESPVTTKYMCVVVKILSGDNFVVTAYYTDRVKAGEVLWTRK